MLKDKFLKYKKSNYFEIILFLIYLVKYEVVFQFFYSVKLRVKCLLYRVNIGNIIFIKNPMSTIRIGNKFQSTNKAEMNGFSYRKSTLLRTTSINSKIMLLLIVYLFCAEVERYLLEIM
jgi:hypothetical protein